MNRHIFITLLVVWGALCIGANAQTPYDAFAPETSRPMLGLDAINTTENPSQCNVINDSIWSTKSSADDISKWLSVDPLSDKYPSISPYAYCNWNPVKYVDPDGRDIYRYDNKTGDIKLYQKTDDNFDQFGKFKYNRKTGDYEPLLKKDGCIKTYTDHLGNHDEIAKGILRNGLNMKQRGATFIVDKNVGPAIDDYFNYALILDEIAGVEISGYIFENRYGDGKKIIQFEPYKNNSFNNSTSRLFRSSELYKAILHFHTHGHADSYIRATTPSKDRDLPAKTKLRNLYPGIQLLILHNYGEPVIY